VQEVVPQVLVEILGQHLADVLALTDRFHPDVKGPFAPDGSQHVADQPLARWGQLPDGVRSARGKGE
jgi:hypothetical protein